jgi:hypothetical protein
MRDHITERPQTITVNSVAWQMIAAAILIG